MLQGDLILSLQKLVKQTVKSRTLMMAWRHLPEEAQESRVVYFIRNTADSIPQAAGSDGAMEVMLKHFETGCIQGNPLAALGAVLNYVYIPLLTAAGQRAGEGELHSTAPPSVRTASRVSFQRDPGNVDSDSSDSEVEQEGVEGGVVRRISSRSARRTPSTHDPRLSYLRDELLVNVKKFSSYVAFTINQVAGEVKLDIPDISDQDHALAAKNAVLVSSLELTVESWCRVMSNTLEEQLKKEPSGNGPLAELEFWKERNSALGSLWEQLNFPAAQKVVRVLKATNSATSSSFEYYWKELSKYCVEAKDNVRFLSTLERHFKNVAHGASFTIVTETMPALLNALRMMWVISRHYNTDERMVPLMERIAWELSERVSRSVNIRTIFGWAGTLHCYTQTLTYVHY